MNEQNRTSRCPCDIIQSEYREPTQLILCRISNVTMVFSIYFQFQMVELYLFTCVMCLVLRTYSSSLILLCRFLDLRFFNKNSDPWTNRPFGDSE